MESFQIIGIAAIIIAFSCLVVISVLHILTSDTLSFDVSMIIFFCFAFTNLFTTRHTFLKLSLIKVKCVVWLSKFFIQKKKESKVYKTKIKHQSMVANAFSKKIVKHFKTFRIFLERNMYKSSTYEPSFIVKWHLGCSVKKN